MEESSPELVRFISQAMNLPLSVSISSLEFALAALKEMRNFLTADLCGPNWNRSQQSPVPQSYPAPGAGNHVITDVVQDTFNGLAAFVIPGRDSYSYAQGVTAQEPGAVNVHITEMLIAVLDRAVPSPPQGPVSSAAIASLLNQVAQRIDASVTTGFPSAFARLSFSDKARVFQFIEGDPSMTPFTRIGGILAFFVAFLFYSEASTFDFTARSLKARPAGWIASKYAGVSDGHCEFRGYYQNRKRIEKD